MDKSNHDLDDIKKCLKDAGVFEDNMDTNVMLQYYSVIKNSESTACVEDEIRRNESSHVESLNEEEGLQLVESDEELEQASPNESAKPIKDSQETTRHNSNVSFSDMPALSDKLLDIVYHEPKYFLAVNFTSDSYKKLTLKERVSLLYNYHTDLNRQMAALAKQSLYPTPRCKDIQASNKFAGSLFKDSAFDDDFIESVDDSVVYTTRSGRQMKRKKYTEDTDFEGESLQNKKIKNADENWEMKKTKVTEKKSVTNTVDQSKSSTKDDDNIQVSQGNTSSKIVSTSVNISAPIPKRASLKKLSNEQIMKRSSLFSPLTTRKTRAETMFDNLIEEEEKKKGQEKEMTIFEESLNDIELDISEIDHVRNDDNEQQPSKIRPAARRAIGTRKRTTREEVEPNLITTSVRKVLKSTARSATSTKNNKKTDAEDKENTNLSDEIICENDVKKINCPLCNIPFPEDEIQDHAATCCEPSDVVPPTLRSSLRKTCDICDKVLPVDASYEEHVQHCLQSPKQSKRK